MPKNLFIIACEPSGDTHGAHLVDELLKRDAGLRFHGLGGPQMAERGVELIHDMTKISALGLGDVLRQYFKYRRIFNQTLARIREVKPDAIILIDSPAFNLRLAKKIRKEIPVIYYIAPQIWAWGKRRIHTIKKTISKIFSILPFEVGIYGDAGVPCEFVGHPLLDQISISQDRAALRREFGMKEDRSAVGLLPGSRESEVRRILPIMLKAASLLRKELPASQFFLLQSPNVAVELYEQILAQYPDLHISRLNDRRYDLVHALDFALVTSGTATLETALMGTPFFLLYKTSWSTYFLGKRLIRVPYLGLVNLLAEKRVVPEFIQNEACPHTIAHEARVLLKSDDLYNEMKGEFVKMKVRLGERGASRKAAERMLDLIQNQNAPREIPDKSVVHSGLESETAQ